MRRREGGEKHEGGGGGGGGGYLESYARGARLLTRWDQHVVAQPQNNCAGSLLENTPFLDTFATLLWLSKIYGTVNIEEQRPLLVRAA